MWKRNKLCCSKVLFSVSNKPLLHDDWMYMCPGTRAQLRQHACPWCVRRYKQPSSLSRHMRYECENAGKRKEQACRLCSKRYFRPDTLADHVQTCHMQQLARGVGRQTWASR